MKIRVQTNVTSVEVGNVRSVEIISNVLHIYYRYDGQNKTITIPLSTITHMFID